MGWVLGVDLGTTFAAAAAWRDGRAEILSLGTRAAAIPSVVFYREDGTTVSGDAAELRSVTEPERVAREFKRRVGDSTPMLIGGTPRSAESVMAVLLRDITAHAVELEGSRFDRIAVAHPASWGQYKLDVLRQAVQLAELRSNAELVPEPVAAAVHYSTLQRIELHDFVGVYDLGGGTFDAAVVRRTPDGFVLYGQPEGIERLGGIDVDAAVLGHVQHAIGLQPDQLDRDDPAVVAAYARLRADCVAAKEALSSDTDAVIPVLLPGLATEVRITRRELEAMIRPWLGDTIAAMRRAIASGGLVPEHLDRILLVGGSSRIPLVGEMVAAELGRPIALDSHPKHAVALGAATIAAPKPVVAAPSSAAPPPPVAPAPPPPASPPPAPTPAWSSAPAAEPARTSSRSTAVIAVVILALVAIAAVAFVATRSSDSSSSSSGDESTSGASGGVTDDDASGVANEFTSILFSIDSDSVTVLKERALPLTTGALHDELAAEDQSFSTEVQSSSFVSTPTIQSTTVRRNDSQTADVEIELTLDVSAFGSTSASGVAVRLAEHLVAVDGRFLVAGLSNCTDGSGSEFSFSFSNSDASASC